MKTVEHRLPDSSIALWQSLIDQMKGQAALGVVNERMAALSEKGLAIARNIDRLDFAAREVKMGSDGFITADVAVLCEACGCGDLRVRHGADLSRDAVCPGCGITHGTFQDLHDCSAFLTQVVYHYGNPAQFLPPLTPEEKIGALIDIRAGLELPPNGRKQ